LRKRIAILIIHKIIANTITGREERNNNIETFEICFNKLESVIEYKEYDLMNE